MAITFPRTDILSAVEGFSDITFDPVEVQELSRTAGGKSTGKDLGPMLWFASYTTGPMTHAEALDFRAILMSLDGVINLFEAHDIRRPAPRAHSDALGQDDGTAQDGALLSVNANNKALALSGLAPGQIVSRGDYLAFDYGGCRALHQAMETIAANGSGTTAQFEVRPHVRPGFEPSADVILFEASALFNLTPKSISIRKVSNRLSAVTFSCSQGGLG